MTVVACPSCSVSLNLADHLVGKKVKCPKCQQVFVVSSPAAPPPSPPPALPLSAPPDMGDPLGLELDEAPTPRRGREEERDDEPRRPRRRPREDDEEVDEPRGGRGRRRDEDDEPRRTRRRPRDDDDDSDEPRRGRRRDEVDDADDDPRKVAARWQTGRSGVRLAMIGAMIIVPLLVVFAIMLTIIAMTAAAQPGRPMPGAKDDTLNGVVGCTTCGVGGFIVIAAVVHLIGQIMCCWSPAPIHQKAVRFVIFFGITIAVFLLSFCVAFLMAAAAEMRSGDLGPMMTTLLFAVGTLALATWCYWIAYLGDVAKRFRSSALEGQCKAIVIGYVAVFFVGLVWSLVTIFSPMPRAQPYVMIVSSWIHVGLYGWYAFAIMRINGLLGESLEGR